MVSFGIFFVSSNKDISNLKTSDKRLLIICFLDKDVINKEGNSVLEKKYQFN